MKPLLVRINFAIRRLYCRIFGHMDELASINFVGLCVPRTPSLLITYPHRQGLA